LIDISDGVANTILSLENGASEWTMG